MARVKVIFVTLSVRKSETNLQVDKKIYHQQNLVKVTLSSDTKPLIVYGRYTYVTLVMCSRHTDSHLQPTNETHTHHKTYITTQHLLRVRLTFLADPSRVGFWDAVCVTP